MRRISLMLSLLAGLAACSSQDKNTKIVVVVWSDLAVPTEMDRIEIDAQGPTAASQPKTFSLATGDDLPAVLVLVPPNNQELPFSVTANGLLGGSTIPVVSQMATVSFLPGQSRVLTLFLGRSCPKGLCAQLDVDPHTLPVYNPKAAFLPPDAGAGARLDGGGDVGAADVGGTETNGVEDGGPTGDGAVDMAADVPVFLPDTGVGNDGAVIATGGTGGSGGTGGGAGAGGSGGARGGTAATGGVGGIALGGSGGIVLGGTGGSTIADAAADTLVTPADAAPDVAVVSCGDTNQICCAGNACIKGGCCVAGTCVGLGASCSTGGTCSNGSCAACDPSITPAKGCATGLYGICAPGTQKCTAAGVWGACVQNVPKGTRDCSSSLDNDCDGTPDNASSTCLCQVGKTQACTVAGLKGICAASTQKCVLSADNSSTAWAPAVCAQTVFPGTETCANMGTDDDCDGLVDDCTVQVNSAVGACLNGGTWSCVAIGPNYCKPSNSAIGTTTPQTVAAPNGSFDWNCDGATTVSSPYSVIQSTACASRTDLTCTQDAYYEVPLTTLRICGKTFSATKYVCSGSPCAKASGIGTIVGGTFACN
jgi:hypothetical protein